ALGLLYVFGRLSCLPGIRLIAQVYVLGQSSAEPAPDRGPALPLAIVGDQAIAFSRGVERVFDVPLLERTGRDPSAQRPRCVIQGIIATACRRAGRWRRAHHTTVRTANRPTLPGQVADRAGPARGSPS